MMRRGSALLVVIGMLVFMVMSALSFAIYMRQNRLPSSFLAQQASSAILVKAALAEAMHELDCAIGDDPYPNEFTYNEGYTFANQASVMNASARYTADGRQVYNTWRSRVYMGLPPQRLTGDTEKDGTNETETVSTLTLEGLAYLPPPLVNTMRYWSRRTPSACWRMLGYDAGRYAFSALNVSDHLDINRLRASVMRDSTSSNRLSLAYLFENAAHTDWESSGMAERFDEKMQTLRDSREGRLVSLADYNASVVYGELDGVGFESPFGKYVASSQLASFFSSVDPDKVRRQLFVTDSWYPHVRTNANELVLQDFAVDSSGNDDWFKDQIGNSVATLEDLMVTADDTTKPLGRFQKRIGTASLAALFDYVDPDNVPISLAAPTIECAPMLTVVDVSAQDFAPTFKHQATPDPPTPVASGTQQVTHHRWTFDKLAPPGMNPMINVNLAAVFPFKNSPTVAPGNYEAQIVVKGFLTDADYSTRVRMNASGPACPLAPTAAEFNGSVPNLPFDKAGFFVATGKKAFSVNMTSGNPLQSALIDTQLRAIRLTIHGANTSGNSPVFAVKETKVTPSGGGAPTVTYDDDPGQMSNPLTYLDANGNPVQVSSNSHSAPTPGNFKLVLMTWVRVIDTNEPSNRQTVDLVPATLVDDQLNGIAYQQLKPNAPSVLGALYNGFCGRDWPVLPLVTQAGGTFDGTTFSPPQNATASANVSFAGSTGGQPDEVCLYCRDPRFNHASENWIRTSNLNVLQGNNWLSLCGAPNSDIFQFVSNAGYLQSMGEIQFLPWTGDFTDGRAQLQPTQNDYFRNAGRYDGMLRDDSGAPNTSLVSADDRYMWQTYWAFGNDRDTNGNDMYEWDINDTHGGVSVSPYTCSLDLFLAALANTPCGWSVADRFNEYTTAELDSHCWNDRSGSMAPLKWNDLQTIAKKMRENFRQGMKFEDFPEWNATGNNFFGATIPDFSDVDRKFLFSYWKNCFANNQQLFLVFVRTEPVTMMSGASDHTPASLGARAVALVWREPVSSIVNANSEAPNGNDHVHRMRILFYHQFD